MLISPMFASKTQLTNPNQTSNNSACPYADALGLNDASKSPAERTAILKNAMPKSHPKVSSDAKQSQCPHLRMTQKQAGINTDSANAETTEETEAERQRKQQIAKDEAEGRLTTANTVYEHVEGIDIDEF